MAQSMIQMFDSIPCLPLNVPGSITRWQDWMFDSTALLLVREKGEKPDTALLLSLNTAQPLQKIPLSAEDLATLAGAQGHILVPADLSGDTRWEASLIKHEIIDSSGLFYEGIKLQTRGDLKGALEKYGEALRQVPTLPRISNLQGLCYRLLDQLDEAEKAYLRETQLMPNAPDAYCNLGILYSKTKRANLARPMFEKSLEKNQLYWNGLFQLSRFLFETEGPDSKLLSALLQRLMICYSDLPQVQELVTSVAAKKGMPIRDYLEKIRIEAGFLGDSSLLSLMKRVEDFRLNGAYLAAVRGYTMIFENTPKGAPAENFLSHWISQRLENIAPLIPPIMKDFFQKLKGTIAGRVPVPASQEVLKEPISQAKATNFTAEEFFELVLFNVMRDGQITPDEMNMVFRLKNTLRINEETHKIIFNRVEQALSAVPLGADAKEFNALELFRQILVGVVRDGVIDDNEKKLVNLAREALEILPAEATAILEEVTA